MEKRILAITLIFILYFIISTNLILEKQVIVELEFNQPNFTQIFSEENNDFDDISYTENFKPDDDYFISQPISYSNYPEGSCKILNASYTEAEYKHIFHFKRTAKCKTPSNDTVYFENSEIYAKCGDSNNPFFSVDPGNEQIFGGSVKDNVTWTSKPEIRNNSEYAFVKCGKFIHALFFLRYSRTASEKANEIRFSRKHDPRPMNVFFFVFDALSRFISYKYMPNTTSFLRNLISNEITEFKDYSAYEFVNNAIPDAFSVPNMCRILYGMLYQDIIKECKINKGKNKEINTENTEKCQKKHSIWSYYQKQGYVTSFLSDTVHDFVSTFTGRKIGADHVFQNYWRSAWSLYNFHEFSNTQRCHGTQNTHNLTFGYMLDFFEKYEKNNKFSYIHLNSAHENSGNIQSVDDEFLHFLKTLLKTMTTKRENFAFVLISDHGWRYSNLIFDEREFAENNSPLFYLVLSKEIEAKLNARENLRHNSKMLVGRYDLNFLLKFLAHFPYVLNESDVEGLGKQYSNSLAVNLLTEKISPNRTCQDLAVPKSSCPCNSFEDIDVNNGEEMSVVKRFYPLLNSYFQMTAKEHDCPLIDNFEYVEGEKFQMRSKQLGKVTIYRLNFTVNFNLKITTEFIFCYRVNATESKINDLKKIRNNILVEYSEGKDRVFLYLKGVKDLENKCFKPLCIC